MVTTCDSLWRPFCKQGIHRWLAWSAFSSSLCVTLLSLAVGVIRLFGNFEVISPYWPSYHFSSRRISFREGDFSIIWTTLWWQWRDTVKSLWIMSDKSTCNNEEFHWLAVGDWNVLQELMTIVCFLIHLIIIPILYFIGWVGNDTQSPLSFWLLWWKLTLLDWAIRCVG